MRKEEQRRASSWESFSLEDIKKSFSTELYEDLKSLEGFCEKMKKEISIDILNMKTIFLIVVGSEDMNWIFEVEKDSPQYYRQIYLTRDDLAFIFRRMNEKRRIRYV